ncbi:MAG: UDP-N-acetylmuramate dehydrogenase [Atopobiaceae bacterium]|nr:UDP-N-acetylmuramate dehydrogenase [Atopobiaceae bacterium]
MSVFNAYMALSGAIDADVIRDERLSRRTTYRIGGPAALVVRCNDHRSLVRTIDVLAHEQVKWVVMGKGSNVLVSDDGYDGCVILLGRDFSRVSFSPEEEGVVTVGAGVVLAKLVADSMSRGLAGLECCAGIPGTVGGAIAMDAGTRNDWIGPRVRDVVALRPGAGLVRHDGRDIMWGYRSTSIPEGDIILEVTLGLTPSTRDAVGATVEKLMARRRRTQPMGRPSCGSVFRNPQGASVGALLDECGLKGYAVGGAQVSNVHANFVVNNGNATAADVMAVISHMHETVLSECGIDLEPEVKFLGFSR